VPPPTQVPVPLHVDALVSVNVLAQAAARHCVPEAYLRQAPAPSHLLSLPQEAEPWSVQMLFGSLAPGATGEQVPIVAVSVHDTHGPLHMALQQTPWVEHTNPAAHSGLVAHWAPLGLRPHEPLMQTAPRAQSALAVQLLLQAATPHANGKQEVLPGVMHIPLPSHVDRAVKVAVAQVGSLQLVPDAYFWHAPAAHLPLVPQLAEPWSTQVLAGSAAPAGTFWQDPAVPGSAHDLHGFMHVVPQQTPCQHWFDAHSVPAEQLAPLIFLPHELPLQTLGATQLSAVVQASKHLGPLHAKGAHGREFGGMHCPVVVHVDGGV
jgi:hypothetical protein